MMEHGVDKIACHSIMGMLPNYHCERSEVSPCGIPHTHIQYLSGTISDLKSKRQCGLPRRNAPRIDAFMAFGVGFVIQLFHYSPEGIPLRDIILTKGQVSA